MVNQGDPMRCLNCDTDCAYRNDNVCEDCWPNFCAKCEAKGHSTDECDDLHAPREEELSVPEELGLRSVWS